MFDGDLEGDELGLAEGDCKFHIKYDDIMVKYVSSIQKLTRKKPIRTYKAW